MLPANAAAEERILAPTAFARLCLVTILVTAASPLLAVIGTVMSFWNNRSPFDRAAAAWAPTFCADFRSGSS
ncbi:hypothetical protein [Falsirhodobacter sp. 1013]|uniref:hypothetical protein n=1 Tax=Falsirhodobacter sp. 1013 TaxID=3417566 RepID=UPI003EBB467D